MEKTGNANVKVWDDATTLRNVRGQLPCPRGSTYTRQDTSSAGCNCGLRLADVMDARDRRVRKTGITITCVSGSKKQAEKRKRARHYSMQSRILGRAGVPQVTSCLSPGDP